MMMAILYPVEGGNKLGETRSSEDSTETSSVCMIDCSCLVLCLVNNFKFIFLRTTHQLLDRAQKEVRE